MNADAATIFSRVRETLSPSGLVPFGWFAPDDRTRGLLIGNVGSDLWRPFAASIEFDDGLPDPLDRWTVAVMAPVAEALGATVRYPFGDPVWPFQRWAMAATGMRPSPIGLLVHGEYGLWTALRAALIFERAFDIGQAVSMDHPCDACFEKPCLNTCPVTAFSADGYDVAACRAHIRDDALRRCRDGGCQARRACPVGAEYTYDDAHQAFHMAAFA